MPPPVPLYDVQAPPDAFHRVRSPGGYEQWYFDAEAGAPGELRLIARFSLGSLFDSQYLRRYRAFLRHPTRHPPPLPEQYPRLEVSIYENGRLAGQLATHAQPAEFAASDGGVMIGESRFERGGDGSIGVHLATAVGMSANLSFNPVWRHPPYPLLWQSSPVVHQWIISQPLAKVEGDIDIAGRNIIFRGLGYHDHRFGAGPLNLRRWCWGRVLQEQNALAFQVATSQMNNGHLIRAGPDGIGEGEPDALIVHGRHWTLSGNHYPKTIHIEQMVFGKPQLIERAVDRLRLVYPALSGSSSPLFCEIG